MSSILCSVASVNAQTVYDSKTLVDSNTTSTSTVNSTNTNTNTNTSTSTSTNTNNNNNVNTSTSTSTNTNTNINVNSGEITNRNINTGDMTNRNINTSTVTSTNTNINTGDMTNRNIMSGEVTYRNINTNDSTNRNINTSNNNNVNQNINTGDMTNRNINTSTSTQDVTSRNDNYNKSDVTQKIVQPPPTAIAPAMMSGGGQDLCTTGVSGAAQTQIFGISFGGTVTDKNCERLKLSKTLYDMGMKVAAVATMCQDRRVFDAMMAAGTPCPYEGLIGAQAKAAWEANPDKVPKYN